ncbi:MAG: hypothetical protein COA79_17050 [Planctomycetota bacterium]|nr:MAG: hypothetical protein COA79_17050 [Planctomycetota bacterium]
MSSRQICKVINSDSKNRKITIDVEGKILKVEKIIGLDFRPGDFACYQTFDGFKKSLVVALNPEEIETIKNDVEDNSLDQDSQDAMSLLEDDFSQSNTDRGVVPLDEEIFNSQLEEERNRKSLIQGDINDQDAVELIGSLFDGDLSVKEEASTVRKLFPMVATQHSQMDSEAKKNFFQKADDVIIRKLINEQSNREVHDFLSGMINRIDDEKGHDDFFRNLSFYLDRLKKMQRKKHLSSKKMGVIFYPVYIYYVRKFTREKIDDWIESSVQF